MISDHSGGLAPIASGANSVASALGCFTGRDPNDAVRTYHGVFNLTPQLGTFYFAGTRNFLFCSDRICGLCVGIQETGAV